MKKNLRSLFFNFSWKFTILAALVLSNTLIFLKTFNMYRNEPQYFYMYRMLGDSLCIARASAAAICFNTLAVMVSMCKVSVSAIRNFFAVRHLSCWHRFLDEKKSMHMMCGILLCLLSAMHTIAHCVNNYNFCTNYDEVNVGLNIFPRKDKVNSFSIFFTVTGITGLLMLVILLIMLISSMPAVRRRNYVIFWYTHHLAFPFIGLLILHSYGCIIKRQKNLEEHWPGCRYPNATVRMHNETKPAHLVGKEICHSPPQFEHDPAQAWKWILIPLFCYILDRLIRIWRGRKNVQISEVIWHEGNVVELRLKQDGFKALPGQYIQVQSPDVAKFEWHPFTLTKCPANDSVSDYFSVHIKILGKWTERLRCRLLVKERFSSSRKQQIINYSQSKDSYISRIEQKITWPRIYVDGPYGGPCQDVTKFSVSVCIAAGIGITPFAAVINALRNNLNAQQNKLTRLYFMWISREKHAFYWFLELLHSFFQELNEMNKPDFFICNFFVTGSESRSEKDLHRSKLSGIEWLRSRLHYGRPKWKDIFDQISNNHRRKKIGVFYTGPRCIVPVIKKTCNQTVGQRNSFVFHKDSFG